MKWQAVEAELRESVTDFVIVVGLLCVGAWYLIKRAVSMWRVNRMDEMS